MARERVDEGFDWHGRTVAPETSSGPNDTEPSELRGIGAGGRITTSGRGQDDEVRWPGQRAKGDQRRLHLMQDAQRVGGHQDPNRWVQSHGQIEVGLSF